MPEMLSTYADLQRALAALPAPKPGTVRVYRGQTDDYPAMLPSGLRRPISKQVIWLTYSHVLYQSLLSDLLRNSDQVTDEMLTAFGLWFYAVAQHYGPGSDFLDVTHSLDVALWFALNDYKTIPMRSIIGPPGPPDPLNDHPSAGELVTYAASSRPGYLYVFDLPKWNGEGLPGLGTLVDVADAPPLFSSSARMRAQAACLVYCRDKGADHLDLKKQHLVGGKPLVVARPLTGLQGLDRGVADLFPSPERDEWYARLLSVPMAYLPEPSPPTLRRVIPVAVYHDAANGTYNNEVRFRDFSVAPPLLHRWIRDAARTLEPGDPIRVIAEAIPIVLEASMLFPYPPGESDHWNHGLLATDVPTQCRVDAVETRAAAGEVSLRNVLFEFSALENAGWDHIVKDDSPVHLLRGVSLVRRDDTASFDVTLIYEDLPGSGPDQFIPFGLHYDAALRQFVITPSRGKPIPLATNAKIANMLAKPVFVALMLLRHLSPALKAEATPRAQMDVNDNGTSKSLFIVGCSKDAARLCRVTAAPHPDWFVLRDSHRPAEPFTYPEHTDGVLELKANVPFSELSAAAVQREVASVRDGSP